MIDLKGKTIFITGASSGIGRECAVKAAQLGAKVILIARNPEKLKTVTNSLTGDGHLYFPCDVTVNDSLEGTVSQSVETLGPISGFIHCAGIESTIPLRNMNPARYEEMFTVNVFAAFEIARLIAKKKYLSSSGGSFIFVSSIRGIRGESGAVGYSSCKAALLGGAKAMAMELAPKKIRVNCIIPGVVETEMAARFFRTIPRQAKEEIIKRYPLGLGQPEDVAHLCMFLLSDVSRWITGTEITIDGGRTAR